MIVSASTALLIDTIRHQRKAKSLLEPGCMREKPTEPGHRHHSLYPWRQEPSPAKPSGTRVVAPVRNAETGADVLVSGTVESRRRGWVMGLHDETRTDAKYDMAWTGEPFTRDQAGLYIMRLDAGGVTFGHESELIWGDAPEVASV